MAVERPRASPRVCHGATEKLNKTMHFLSFVISFYCASGPPLGLSIEKAEDFDLRKWSIPSTFFKWTQVGDIDILL